jgi:pimeloyl-ACP methyl ester carboxylesterase
MTIAPSPPQAFAPGALPQLRSTSVFGRRICYYDIGRGAPLVLVHGVGGDADQWAFCFSGLAASHRVIAFDLLGFGRSDKPLIDYRIAGYVEVLERFLGALGIGRASLVGHSLGGWIAAAFALQFPHRVDRLVLADAAGIDEGAIGLPIDLNVSSRQHMREVLEFMFHDKRMVSAGLVDLAYSLRLERNDGYTIRSVLETLAVPQEKLDAKLGGLAVPTLLLWGEQDALTPLSMARAWERLIEGSKLQVIPQCGHLPPLEKANEFVRAVMRFLAPRLDPARATG